MEPLAELWTFTMPIDLLKGMSKEVDRETSWHYFYWRVPGKMEETEK